MNRFYFLLLVITNLLLIGCSDDEDIIINEDVLLASCLEMPENIFENECLSDSTLGLSVCKTTEYIGDHNLTEESKKYLNFYCKSLGSTIEYINDCGEILSLHIISKSYDKRRIRNLRGPPPCRENKPIVDECYCAYVDVVSIRLSNVDTTNTITLNLSTQANPDYCLTNYTSDVLRISRSFKVNSTRYQSIGDFHIPIASKDGNEFLAKLQEFYDEIELNGKTYRDVISQEKILSLSYKYFLNKEFGLFGFIDENGITWTLNE